ncbi:MAG: YicC family protein [Dysgonamonadaceae bacterium]|nr:YicC family protein [Dysgonamonadaceae bacterium]
MIQSMTGFGKVTAELQGKKISVEIKSLNSKQLDISTRIPNAYRDKEIEIRNLLSPAVERGKVDFLIYLDSVDTNMSSKINPAAIEMYYKQIKDAAQQLQLELPSDWFSILLRLPDSIKTEVVELDDAEWNMVKKTIREALKTFVAFRIQEGAMLEKVFRAKIEAIAGLLHEIDTYDPERTEKIKLRLSESIKKLDIACYDENRFEQEMIYYIERLDVNEEKSRLDNHLKYFLETMDNEKSQGRKLGFIAQEMGREINTLGSKSNHVEMQKIVVRMKDELEQIKEQILNVL